MAEPGFALHPSLVAAIREIVAEEMARLGVPSGATVHAMLAGNAALIEASNNVAQLARRIEVHLPAIERRLAVTPGDVAGAE